LKKPTRFQTSIFLTRLAFVIGMSKGNSNLIAAKKNKEELVSGIQTFWDTVTAQKCPLYIGHLQKVIPAVIQRQGRASGHGTRHGR